MGRTYAGVLGLTACLLLLARGALAGAALESTMSAACLGLFGFAALGWIAGRLAERFVEESVRTRFQLALQSRHRDNTKANTAAGT
jgi:hypothetical protein